MRTLFFSLSIPSSFPPSLSLSIIWPYQHSPWNKLFSINNANYLKRKDGLEKIPPANLKTQNAIFAWTKNIENDKENGNEEKDEEVKSEGKGKE